MGERIMNHPEGRIVAIQQQMFFAQMLAEKMDTETEIVLRKLAMVGLSLTLDINEIAVDASAVLPNLNKYKTRLKAVPQQ
jgi:hypothetical protein